MEKNKDDGNGLEKWKYELFEDDNDKMLSSVVSHHKKGRFEEVDMAMSVLVDVELSTLECDYAPSTIGSTAVMGQVD